MDYRQFFVKLPLYVGGWVVCKYKRSGSGGPVSLPRSTHAGRIIYQNLISNPDFELLTPRCYNAMMFSARSEDTPEEWRDRLPDDRGEFVGFGIPREHWYNGEYIPCDDTMQLGKQHNAEFVNYLVDEFWDDFDAYAADHERAFLIDNPGRHHDEYYMLLDFLDFYHINIDCSDAFYRQFKRRKRKMKEEESLCRDQ